MNIININIAGKKKLPSLNELSREISVTAKESRFITNSRKCVKDHLLGQMLPKRILAIIGPCSVHNVEEAYEYAVRLSKLSKKVGDKITILMRVCGDKPRTRKDWEGFMKDPHLDGSFDMAYGFKEMRKLMLSIVKLGIPIATEALHRTQFNVISDLVSYAWIGARTIADPEKRAMASGLTMPVGMKNPDHGPLSIAINAIDYARHPGVFDGPDENNVLSIIETSGNKYAHLILRGSSSGQNYDSDSIKQACKALEESNLINRVMIDCSHGNSNGDYLNQIKVANSLTDQIITQGNKIVGFMIESYLKGGKQDGKKIGTKECPKIKSGLSVTDACLSWEDTEKLILGIYKRLKS